MRAGLGTQNLFRRCQPPPPPCLSLCQTTAVYIASSRQGWTSQDSLPGWGQGQNQILIGSGRLGTDFGWLPFPGPSHVP